MKKILFLLILIFIISCKSDSKEEKVKTVIKPKPIEKVKIITSEKNLIYNLDNNTIVVAGDTVRIESPFIYSFDGIIENKKIQIHLSNNLTGEFGGYEKTASVYIDGEEEIFGCYFKKNKNNKEEIADVTTYYSMNNDNTTICKLKLYNVSKPNMFIDCEYKEKTYKINPSTIFLNYKCFDEINYTLSDCKKQFKKKESMREYVPHRNYSFIAEIFSNDEKFNKIESELKYLFIDSLDIKNHKKWKHQFQENISKDEEDCYTSETISTIVPAFIDDNIFVTSSYSYNYMGGAHGMMVTNYENYDLETGKIIELNEILNFSSNEFKVFYENKVKETYADGMLNENVIPMSDKFFILPTGIVFSYAPYELMGFAAGEPHIFMSYKDLEPFITNNSILDKYWIKK
jgi:hypothetical protein